MTCVLVSSSIPSATTLPSMKWSPMTSTAEIPTHSTIGLPSQTSSYGGSPNDGAVYRKTNEGIKKRASRAGTRSVSSLTAAQLERKRNNDREAQRAIRQRTKDHIDSLEKALNEVKDTLEAREKLLTAAHSRNQELEEENAVLRMRLSDNNHSVSITKYARPAENAVSAPPSAASEASGPVSQRSGSISHTVNFPMNNASWQQSPFTTGPLVLSTNTDTQSRSMVGWRARDSPQATSATTNTTIQGVHPPQAIPYTPNGTEERSAWANQYEFGVPIQPTAQHYSQQATPQQDTHFTQSQGQNFQNTSQQPHGAFHPPLLLPQNGFQAMNVPDQGFYQFQQQAQTYTGQAQYSQTSNQNNNNFNAAQTSPSTQYHNTGTEHAFSQQVHPPMQFRDETDSRDFAMARYPSG